MNDELFDEVWNALVEHGSSRKSEDAVRRFWNTLTPKQKDIVHKNIPRKVKEGKFVQYDPIRAIKENSRKYQIPEPTNYNGRSLKQGVAYVIAKYNGAYGTYTLDEAKEYDLEIKSIISR